jgi:hypothetical protein
MKFVNKFAIVLNSLMNNTYLQTVEVPYGTRLVSVTVEEDCVYVNGLVEAAETAKSNLRIWCVGTNHGVVPNGPKVRFLGSVPDGKFTYHLFTEDL